MNNELIVHDYDETERMLENAIINRKECEKLSKEIKQEYREYRRQWLLGDVI